VVLEQTIYPSKVMIALPIFPATRVGARKFSRRRVMPKMEGEMDE
jgi:hypothetical protein